MREKIKGWGGGGEGEGEYQGVKGRGVEREDKRVKGRCVCAWGGGDKGVMGKNSASELRNCVKDEVAVLGPPSLAVLMVCTEVKQH